MIEELCLRLAATLFDAEPVPARHAVFVSKAHVPADALNVGEGELRNSLVTVWTVLGHRGILQASAAHRGGLPGVVVEAVVEKK